MKQWLRKIIPPGLLLFYHKVLAILASWIYGFPANKMIVVGITGTAGKSTTVFLLTKILEQAGWKVGVSSTIQFKIGEKEWLNKKKMTMLGRFQTQKLLKQMVEAGCDCAIVETTSEGIKQCRHLGINYDLIVLTNLGIEHIESHGGFESYKKAKGELFQHLTRKKRKIIPKNLESRIKNQGSRVKGQGDEMPKIKIINTDNQYADYFLGFKSDRTITFGLQPSQGSDQHWQATEVELGPSGLVFKIKNQTFHLRLYGRFNVFNALAAISVAQTLGIKLETCAQALAQVSGIPGRVEFIEQGQPFKIIVDYAFTPQAMTELYKVIAMIKPKRVIHVLGGTGGGRDRAKLPVLGQIAGQKADMVITTNEDPYDDDPMEIINQVATGAISAGKTLDQNLLKILDRRQAIRKALELASEGDLVLITGKGSEQAMAIKGKLVPWDDRQVVREELEQELRIKESRI